MSTHFNGYRFPKRDLWHVVSTLRSHLAANHRYAVLAYELQIVQYRMILRSGDRHSDSCHTHYLGQCSCDFWSFKELVRDYVTDKQRDQDGLIGQFIEYGHDYVMLIRGDYRWVSNVPAALAEYLGLRKVNYNDSALPIPPEDRKNRKIADSFDQAISSNRYFLVPLLDLDDIEKMQWTMALFLGRRAWKQRREHEAATLEDASVA